MSRRSDALSLARGDVRDGVAAIEHFRELVASRRVGPRMLARAVPEMEAGCAPLDAALVQLTEAVASALTADPEGVDAVRALLAHARARVTELSTALAAQGSGAMDARARLAVDAVVRRIAGDLGEVMRLVDLLGSPVTSETTSIDFADALEARKAAGKRRTGGAVVQAAVTLRAAEIRVGDARLLLELLEQAVLAVVRAGVDAPAIVVENGPEGFPVFTVAEGTARPGGLVFETAAREALPPAARALDVLQAAARHAGITLTLEGGGRRVTIAL